MQSKIFLIFLLILSTPVLSKGVYTMTKDDFAKQFDKSNPVEKVYCQNKTGKTVWLHCNNITLLILTFNDNSTVKLMLMTIKLNDGVVEGVKFNNWVPSSKVFKYNFNEVKYITIPETPQEFESPYFNADSSSALSKHKNDSLENLYTSGNEIVLLFTTSKDSRHDTLEIIENACYHLSFKNGHKTEFGVVQKITQDSIYITNYFNSNVALKNNKRLELFGFLFSDIEEIRLLKSGGFSNNTIHLSEYNWSTKTRLKNPKHLPYWYTVHSMNGSVNLYRLWRTDRGYSAIKEVDGHTTW